MKPNEANQLREGKRCVVIGAGIAGIAVAIRMRRKGYEVDLFEANEFAGGKLSSETSKGYRFDMGPSIFTMPEYVDDLFRLCGKNPRDTFNYAPLDPVYQYFFEDGSSLSSRHSKERFAEVMALNTKDSREAILNYLNQTEAVYRLTSDVFLKNSLHKFRNYLTWPALRGLLNFWKIGAFQTMNACNQKHLSDPRLIQVFNRYATYNGSSPYLSPSTLNVIAHVEIVKGAYYPIGGMYSITSSLMELAKEIGIRFHFFTPVQRILIRDRSASGVATAEGDYLAEVVVSDVDVFTCYQRLLPSVKRPTKSLSQPKSSSGIIFYWGIKREFPELGLHNILFSADYEKEFQAIFSKKSVYGDPTVYINITSKHTKSDAPPGCENWFTFINVPNNCGQDWDQLVSYARQCIVQKINRMLKADMESYIETEMIFDPRVIEHRTASAFGAIYGNSSNNKFAAFLRHPNFSREIKNLYFCGGSVHPGPSIPLCLLSAKIVADMIK